MSGGGKTASHGKEGDPAGKPQGTKSGVLFEKTEVS